MTRYKPPNMSGCYLKEIRESSFNMERGGGGGGNELLRRGGGEILGTCVGGLWKKDRVTRGAPFFSLM